MNPRGTILARLKAAETTACEKAGRESYEPVKICYNVLFLDGEWSGPIPTWPLFLPWNAPGRETMDDLAARLVGVDLEAVNRIAAEWVESHGGHFDRPGDPPKPDMTYLKWEDPRILAETRP